VRVEEASEYVGGGRGAIVVGKIGEEKNRSESEDEGNHCGRTRGSEATTTVCLLLLQ
jgi:hypothetical protein